MAGDVVRKFKNGPIVLKVDTETEFRTKITKIKDPSSYEGRHVDYENMVLVPKTLNMTHIVTQVWHKQVT